MILVRLILYIIIFSALTSCENSEKANAPLWQPDAVEDYPIVKAAVRVNPTSYYWQDGQTTGFDYNLLQSFANYINTKIKIIPVATAARAITLLKEQKVDMAAGALGVAQTYKEQFEVSEPYYESKQYMIYRYPDAKPKHFGQISVSDIDISENPSHIELLEKLYVEHNDAAKASNPNTARELIDANNEAWHRHADTPSYRLIEMVNLGLIRYTLADAHELSATQFLYPYVKTAFTTSEKMPIVWLFNRTPPKATSEHLVHLANDLFATLRENGELARLTKSHAGHLELLPYAEKLTFIEAAYRKLSKHKRYFKMVADRHHLDWKLIAAMAYQESHWNSKAVSPTGVKGIMMLTKEIAKRYEVHDRLDPYQSIIGGTKYLNELLAKIPAEIPKPDRIWMALAAYLAGYGHLEDAFRLTRERKANTSSWIELSRSLKLLQQPEWYQKSKHGKPRDNVVSYINNIRNYQFLLSLLEEAISTDIPDEQFEFIAPNN